MKETVRDRSKGRPRAGGLDKAILDAALKILSRDGFVRLSLDAVAIEAETSRPAIYRRYTNKEDLAVAAIMHLRGPVNTSPSGDMRVDMIKELTAFQQRVREGFALRMVGTVLAEENHNPRLLELYRQRIVNSRRDRIRAVLGHGMDTGQLDPAKAPLIEVAITMAVGAYYAHYLKNGHADDGWPTRIVDLLLSGLFSPSPSFRRDRTDGDTLAGSLTGQRDR